MTPRVPRGRGRPRRAVSVIDLDLEPVVTSRATRVLPTRQNKSIYVEVSSETSSDEELVPFTEKTLPLNKRRAHTHIIWDNEGQYFAAIIIKVGLKKKWFHVRNMVRASETNNMLWKYNFATKICKPEHIKFIIPTPKIQGTSSGRNTDTYRVDLIHKYWL